MVWNVVKNLHELPELTEINRLPMSTGLIPYGALRSALDGDASEFEQSLDGEWEFALYPAPEKVPAAFAEPGAKLAGLRMIPVPSNWTRQNTGDIPIYTNVKMPFENNPPLVPAENPTGIYRRAFTVPAAWRGRRVCIRIGGAESYLEVYLNGKFIGMGKDTRLCSDFELTPALNLDGENTLVCKVVRWSDASYVEDQDQWWQAGMYRSVKLYSTGMAYLEDVAVNGDLEVATGTGLLRIETHLGFDYATFHAADPGGPRQPYAVRAVLCDFAGREVWRGSTGIDYRYRVQQYRGKISAGLPGILPWSAECPNLYRLGVELVDPDGRVIDCRACDVGFRHIEIRDRKLLFNGKMVYIHGVNRHEHDERAGKTLSLDSMLEDIRLLKAFNFNAVRCCHYPDDERWYALCDRYGIYVLDEADLENHANYDKFCRDPRWRNAYVSRVERMVRRDRNHPSIFGWSMGNESGNGENHAEAVAVARRLDPSRLIHHEGELKECWWQGRWSGVDTYGPDNDLVGPMYPALEEIIEFSRSAQGRRPLIMCEYSHAMGNSNGSLADYWRVIESMDGLQGGFIWDWVDQGLLEHTPGGTPYWTYGGDYGETSHDFDFCINGLVWPDRTVHPAMYECRYLFRPVRVRAVDLQARKFELRNAYNFRSLAHLEARWALAVNGVEVASGALPLPATAPETSGMIDIPFPSAPIPGGGEAQLNVEFVLRNSEGLVPAGTPVAAEQIDVTAALPVLPVPPPQPVTAAAALRTTAARFTVNAGELEIVADRKNAALCRVAFRGEPLVVAGPELNLWRAATDNDGIRGWDGQENKSLGLWLKAGFDRLADQSRQVSARKIAGMVELKFSGVLVAADTPTRIEWSRTMLVSGDGGIRVSLEAAIASDSPTIPRFGEVLELAPGFENIEYYGRGPHENYIDRRASAFLGRYTGTATGFYVPYIMPQENGNRTDVRELELGNGRTVLEVTAEAPFEFGAGHYRADDLFAARHTAELVPHAETILTLDWRQSGLGTNSCGPATRPEYRMTPGNYRFDYRLRVRE